MTLEELSQSPVLRFAGSNGRIYETTGARADELAKAAYAEGVELKRLIRAKNKETGEEYDLNPFDGEAMAAAAERGDERARPPDGEADSGFSMDALKAGAERGAIGLINPWDWVRGIGTAATTLLRGAAKGTVGTAIKAFRGAVWLGESATNYFTGYDDHTLSDAIGKVDKGFEKGVDTVLPDFFELSGEYDGVEGAKEATGAVGNVVETVTNVAGIGAITKGLAASEVAAAKAAGVVDTTNAAQAGMKVAHTATGAMFGLGKYGDVASDPNGPGGARQQAAALVAGAGDAVFFGIWNPLKVSQRYASELSPFMQATRKEITKRVMVRVGQAVESGATMALVEAVKQGAEQVASIGTEKVEGVDEEGNAYKNWAARTVRDSAMEVGAQFLVGSAFVAMDVAEQNMGRFGYNRARKAQGEVREGLSDKMKVAMTYQVEKNRKAICPQYDRQARFALQARLQKQEGDGFLEQTAGAYKESPDVKSVNEDGSVVFKDGSVWRLDPRIEGGATITVSDGTILSESGELLGYRPRQESGAEPRVENAQVRAEDAQVRAGDAEVRAEGAKPESNALLLLQQLDEGKLPVEEVAVGDVEALAPTENGNVIGEYDPAKAKPIVVWEDMEGNRHAVTGGKRLSMATASGAETVKAVVVREADGWSEADARGLGATENLREGHGGIKNIVDAVDSLGADRVAELAGWHQAHGSREFASTIRKGLAVAQKAGPELKAALADGAIGESFAYNAAQVLSMERVGEGWDAAQRELAGLVGKVGPEELEAVLWGLKRQLAEGTSAIKSGDFAAAIAEERAKYNEKKGGKPGQLDSDAVLMETEDHDLKTLGELEAEQGDNRQPTTDNLDVGGRPSDVAPELAAAEGAGQNKAVQLQPVAGKPGTFATLSHPKARFTVDGEKKVVAVDGLTAEDFAPARGESAAALVARIEAYAAENGLSIGFRDDVVMEAWRATREGIKAEAAERFAAKDREARRVTVVDQLKKSGLAEGVVETAEDFNRMFEEMSGEALRAGEEVYGFVDPKTKKIYLNPEFFATGQGLEAPIHEFGHLGVIACERVNKAVYDRGMKLAMELLESGTDGASGGPGPGSRTGVAGLVDMILNDRVYSKQSREVQAQELLAQLIGKRGAAALKAETNKTVVQKIKAWLVEFWNTFGKALGLKDITPEQAEKMTLEDVADAIRAEMFSGRKYGEGLDRVEFADGGARVVTKPTRIKRKLTGRRKAVDEFVKRMGGAEDPANTETDMLALWVDNGGRLFDKLPFEIETGYSKGNAGVKKTRSSVADEFAESTAFYQDLDPAQRKVFFGTDKLEYGAIGEGLKNKLAEAGITRFTREDGTIDYEAAIAEFQRQWTNYERGNDFLKERGEYEEEAARQYVEEMERAEAAEREAERAANDEISAEEAAARAEMEASGRFSKGKRKLLFSRAVAPSKLGDGKQRYYEVPFDKAVDKIVKNRKPVSDEHVFISETPAVFKDIGMPALPVMMNQQHVLSCYFGAAQGVKAGNMHGLGDRLKSLPKSLARPMMIIANETNPSSSVVAIVKMQDKDGHTVIVPVEINGIGRSNEGYVTSNIVKSAFGKKNLWSEKVAKALRDEVDGKVSVFYIDSNEARQISNRLAREAFNFGKSERQLLSGTKGTVHSIADDGSPVKGVGAQKDSQQFKRWFGGSKVVDANGEPLKVYRRDNDSFTVFDFDKTQQNDAGWLGKGFYFYGDKGEAERSTGYGKNLRAFYLNARNPYFISAEEYNALVEADNPTKSAAFTQWLKDEGYDSVYWNGDGRKEWMVLEPTQIKSATDNIGTFDPGNPDVRFSRGTRPEAKYVKLTRVADDAGAGELTNGAIAASAELMRQAPTPLTQKGTRYVSLPLSELHALSRYLTGHAMPAEMESGKKLGAAGKASLKHRKLTIAADVLGVVDKTDAAAETSTLKQHGFFKHEDANWCATHSPTEVRQERERSEDALSSRLEALADRRISGREPGGNAAGRKVFADQLAKVVMSMPHGQPGVLGAMQTVAGALQKRVKGNDAEADAFIDWMKGGTPVGGMDAQTRKLEMFSAFLIMPKEMEARAKGWYDAIRSTIAADQKLADTFRKMTARSMSEQGYKHLESEILRMQDAQTEAAIKKLQAEANEPIKAGGKLDQAKETVVLACDDRMGAAVVRVDAAAKAYLAAQKKLMAAAKTPAEKAQIKQQTDLFMGQLAQAKNQAELSRTAWERGRDNADARYLWRMVDLLNEATVRDGLKSQDLSLYLDQMRVIETRGLSGSRGESARQAQLILDAMRRRLGGDFAKVEAFARKFHAIHEQELLNNPLLEKILGKGTADYWRSQTSYVTTKRTFSPEELAEIEAARKVLAASGAAGGDTVVGQMFKYCGRPEATAKLKGSFADKQEVMSATFEKVAEVQRFLRRSEYVIRLRDMLKLANVEGVHDLPAGKNEFKSNARYGSIGYMENGHRRVLVVPKEIARGFERQATYDTGALKICAAVNNVARQLWIDFNPVYWQRNISRNAGSIEMNMPGMRESIVKRGARFVFPGLAPVTEMAMTHLVRHLPEKWSLPLRKLWGEHTALFYAPKAKRMAMWITDHSEMQRRLWDAQKRGDLGAVQEMMEDQRDMLAAMRANMLVGLGAGKASGTAGFLDESVRTVGKTMQREMQDLAALPKWRRALNAVNIFQKNAKQQVFEDIMAKFSAYLHDRAQFAKGNNRTAEESGLVVKKNVSIGEGERKGESAGMVQAIFQPFWNMVEKGVVRNVKAYGERPGETFQKAAWRIAPMIEWGLIGSGAIAAWILKANDGDEEKAKNGPMGDVYRFARDAQRAYQNCSNYVRNNYHVTPLFTDGYTSVVIGMPLTDEERLLKPIARFVTDAAAVASGTKESMDVAGFLSDATGVIAPDFKIAGALPTLLDDTVHALMENPTDYYTGGQKYDKDLYAVRNESWEMRGKFAAAMGKRIWNDFGGRNVLPVDRAGVDNGLGKAPGWVAAMVNDIPVVSPILRSFVKVQVGSPRRDAAEISEAEQKRRAVCSVLAKELFGEAQKAKRDVSMDAEKYCGLLQKWEKTYGLTPEELASIEAKYLNAWRAYEGAQYKADGEREKFRAKAEKLGLDAANLWLDFD